MRILVVEDDFISRRLLCRFLEGFGECDVAINGQEALTAVEHAIVADEHYDLICLDIMMPEMDGHESLKRIRELEAKNGTPVGQGARIVMTTSLEDHKNIRSAFSSSADGYVVKPVDKKKLISTLKDLGLEIEIPL
jgi:two-component system chemotaxis response regulator CheY|nr:response regulator [Candidatus Krumholzibacteria bacterium]